LPYPYSRTEDNNLLGLIKEKVSHGFNYIAIFFHKAGFTPLSLTFLSLLFSIFSALVFYFGESNFMIYFIAPLLLLISGFFDGLDGACARLFGKVTKIGAFMDSIVDRFGEIFVYSSLILKNLCDLNWGLMALSLSLMVSYIRARAEVEDVGLQGIGLAERPERILIISISSFLRKINLGIILISVLTCITVAQRIIYFYKKTYTNIQ
jgi:archaetidylinositol phosphate synthase